MDGKLWFDWGVGDLLPPPSELMEPNPYERLRILKTLVNAQAAHIKRQHEILIERGLTVHTMPCSRDGLTRSDVHTRADGTLCSLEMGKYETLVAQLAELQLTIDSLPPEAAAMSRNSQPAAGSPKKLSRTARSNTPASGPASSDAEPPAVSAKTRKLGRWLIHSVGKAKE